MIPERPGPILSEASTGSTDKQEPAAEQPRRSFAQHLKDLFGKLAEAVTGKPTPSLVQRRKRRDERKGAFSRALVLTARAVRRLFHQAANDDQEIQIETERLLRLEIDEYAREQESFDDDSKADHQHVTALDLKM
jgi:hypothetical protein